MQKIINDIIQHGLKTADGNSCCFHSKEWLEHKLMEHLPSGAVPAQLKKLFQQDAAHAMKLLEQVASASIPFQMCISILQPR